MEAPEYTHKWTTKVTPGKRIIPILRASAHRISGKDCGGWQTPNTMDGGQTSRGGSRKGELLLGGQARAAGWPTPKASEAEKDGRTPRGAMNEINRGKGPSLSAMSHVSGWPMAGWVSPTVQDHSRGTKPPRPWDTGIPLSQQISGTLLYGGLASMASGVESLHGKINFKVAMEQILRPMKSKQTRYVLNHRFSLWLMGYPAGWACLGARAMQSCRK